MDIHTGYGVRITPSGGSATLIGGVENQSCPIDVEHMAKPSAGNPFASAGQIVKVQPRGLFSSYQLDVLLPLLGLRGACLAGGVNPGLEMFQLAGEKCGAVKSGNVHRKLVIPNGLVVARSISVSHRQSAQMQCEALSVFDGTNAPVIVAENQAAPTGLTHTHEFTLGPITVPLPGGGGSQQLEGNLELQVNFNNRAETDGGDSDPHDTHIQVPEIIPDLTIKTRDIAKFKDSAIPLKGLHMEHTTFSVVLRRYLRAQAGFSDAAEHIKLTFDGMLNFEEVWSAQANKRGEASLKFTALDDNTNAPIVSDVAFDLNP